MKNALLQFRGVDVYYHAIHAVRNLSMEVHEGEIVALIGSNGAGKTSVLRAASRLIPFKGEIVFQDSSVSNRATHQLVGDGLVHAPEGRGIFLNLSVRENLLLGSYARQDRSSLDADQDTVLKMFPRLSERLHASAGTLSGGEQQMLAIGRALLGRPKVLMLDEPSLGLAPKVVQQIFAIIKELNQKGMTILLVEQNARQALKLCHRAYVLESGRLKMSGRGSDLLDTPEIQEAYLGH
jgi:branched-chain amino acid transport system ATP-binding protein